MRKLKTILLIILACLALGAADLWLLGKVHFCHLWLTREKDPVERHALETKAQKFTYVFWAINLAAGGILLFIGMRKAQAK